LPITSCPLSIHAAVLPYTRQPSRLATEAVRQHRGFNCVKKACAFSLLNWRRGTISGGVCRRGARRGLRSSHDPVETPAGSAACRCDGELVAAGIGVVAASVGISVIVICRISHTRAARSEASSPAARRHGAPLYRWADDRWPTPTLRLSAPAVRRNDNKTPSIIDSWRCQNTHSVREPSASLCRCFEVETTTAVIKQFAISLITSNSKVLRLLPAATVDVFVHRHPRCYWFIVDDRAFPVTGSRCWRSLPHIITSAPTLAVFRKLYSGILLCTFCCNNEWMNKLMNEWMNNTNVAWRQVRHRTLKHQHKSLARVLIFQPMDTYYIRYITAEALVVVVVVDDDDDGDDDDDTTMQKNCTFPQQRCWISSHFISSQPIFISTE